MKVKTVQKKEGQVKLPALYRVTNADKVKSPVFDYIMLVLDLSDEHAEGVILHVYKGNNKYIFEGSYRKHILKEFLTAYEGKLVLENEYEEGCVLTELVE